MFTVLMEGFDFFEPEEKYGSIKATVHSSGRLGFSTGAINYMHLSEDKMFKIAKRKEDSGGLSGDVIYLIPEEMGDDLSFRVLKAGSYFYLKTKRLFNQLNIDYRNESVIYEIEEVKENDKKYYRLTRKKKRSSAV